MLLFYLSEIYNFAGTVPLLELSRSMATWLFPNIISDMRELWAKWISPWEGVFTKLKESSSLSVDSWKTNVYFHVRDLPALMGLLLCSWP